MEARTWPADESIAFGAQSANDAFALVDEINGVLEVCYANDAFIQGSHTFCMDPSDPYSLIGKLSAGEAESVQRILRDAMVNGIASRVCVQALASTETRWLEIAAHPWPVDGKRRAMIVMKDITAAREYKNQVQIVSRAVEDWPDAVAIFDLPNADPHNRHISYVNEAMCALLGLAREEILASGIAQHLLAPNDRASFEHAISALALGEGIDMEVRAQLANGCRPWIHISIHRLGQNALEANSWMGVCRDVTGQKRSSDEIALLRSIIEEAADLVIITDATSPREGGPLITYVNRSFASFIGEQPNQLVGSSLFALQSTSSDERVIESVRDRLSSCAPIAHELRMRRIDGAPDVWMEFTARPLRDESGRASGWLWLGRDITMRKAQYRQTAELVAALDLSDEAITIYKVLNHSTLEITYENRIAADEARGILPWMLANGQQRGRIEWERLAREETLHLLVRYHDNCDPIWLTLELRPLLSPGGDLESLVVIHHALERRLVRRRLSPGGEAMLLGEEVVSYASLRDRRDALSEIVARECGAVLTYSPLEANEDRSLEVSIARDRCGASVVLQPGIVCEDAVALTVVSASQLSARQATGLRVLLETISHEAVPRAS